VQTLCEQHVIETDNMFVIYDMFDTYTLLL